MVKLRRSTVAVRIQPNNAPNEIRMRYVAKFRAERFELLFRDLKDRGIPVIERAIEVKENSADHK